jgi:hypothetical protein
MDVQIPIRHLMPAAGGRAHPPYGRPSGLRNIQFKLEDHMLSHLDLVDQWVRSKCGDQVVGNAAPIWVIEAELEGPRTTANGPHLVSVNLLAHVGTSSSQSDDFKHPTSAR